MQLITFDWEVYRDSVNGSLSRRCANGTFNLKMISSKLWIKKVNYIFLTLTVTVFKGYVITYTITKSKEIWECHFSVKCTDSKTKYGRQSTHAKNPWVGTQVLRWSDSFQLREIACTIKTCRCLTKRTSTGSDATCRTLWRHRYLTVWSGRRRRQTSIRPTPFRWRASAVSTSSSSADESCCVIASTLPEKHIPVCGSNHYAGVAARRQPIVLRRRAEVKWRWRHRARRVASDAGSSGIRHLGWVRATNERSQEWTRTTRRQGGSDVTPLCVL